MKKIKNWNSFNEGIFNYFSKEEKEKRAKSKKSKYISDIEDKILDFNVYLKLLDEHKNSRDAFDYIERFIDSYVNLARALDKYYNNSVKNNNENIEEYQDICYKVIRTINQVTKLKFKLSGWSIGYDPQQIMNDAREKIYKHEERIRNIKKENN